jgi:hypothetical protein
VGETTGPTIRDVVLTSNTAIAFGGGIYINLAHPTLINVNISLNNAREGKQDNKSLKRLRPMCYFASYLAHIHDAYVFYHDQVVVLLSLLILQL